MLSLCTMIVTAGRVAHEAARLQLLPITARIACLCDTDHGFAMDSGVLSINVAASRTLVGGAEQILILATTAAVPLTAAASAGTAARVGTRPPTGCFPTALDGDAATTRSRLG